MEAILEIVTMILNAVPHSTERIVDSFRNKTGLVGDNGYEMVHFPEDQDEYGIEVEGWAVIPPGMVELTWWHGDKETLLISEMEYRKCLLQYFSEEKNIPELVEYLRKIPPRETEIT